MSNDFTQPVVSPLHIDRSAPIGNSAGSDNRGRAHVKIANTGAEPIPITGTISSVADLLTNEIVQSVISVSTTPQIVRVGATNLAQRKLIFLQSSGRIRVGSGGIDINTGILLFKDQFFALPMAETLDLYVCAVSGTVNVLIGEIA